MTRTRSATPVPVATEPVSTRPLMDVLDDPAAAHVYTHSITSLAAETGVARTLPGYARYDERAVLLARPHDVVCVSAAVDSAYLAFLDGLGLGAARERLVVVGGDAAATLPARLATDRTALARVATLVGPWRGVTLFPYVVSTAEHALRAALERTLGRPVALLGGPADLAACANQKHWIHAEAGALGVPLAPGEVLVPPPGGRLTAAALAAAAARHLDATGRVIVRATHSTSGSGILVMERGAGPDAPAPAAAASEDLAGFAGRHGASPCLVQVMYEVLASPNVQLVVTPDGEVACVGVTDQRLDGQLRYVGSAHPASARTLAAMLASAAALAHGLGGLGYRGLLGFDFIEYRDPRDGGLRHALAEVNARVNAATYACAIRARLDVLAARAGRPRVRALRSAVVATRARSFGELARVLGPRLFDPATGRGVVPYNTGCLPEGECDLAVLGGSREEVESLHDAIRPTL